MANPNHYEILGVDKNAAADELKRAFRKKASKAHPDRGGNADTMARLNYAMAVLEDPARRAAYDERGVDNQGMTLLQEAAEMPKKVINGALEAPDGKFLQEANRMLEQGRRDGEADIQSMEARRVKLLRRRESVRHTGHGSNLAHVLIDQHLAELDKRRARADHAVDVMVAGRALLAAYECDEMAVEPVLQTGHFFATTTSR